LRKLKRTYKDQSLYTQFDKFFEILRHSNIFAFQNQKEPVLRCLEKQNVCYLVTIKSKKNFFKDKNMLIDEGIELTFCNFNEETLKLVKTIAVQFFGKKVFIKVLKDDTRLQEDKSVFSGKIKLLNFKRKEENK
jgi:hypothetical protein